LKLESKGELMHPSAGARQDWARFLELLQTQGRFKFCKCAAGTDKNLNPPRTLVAGIQYTQQMW